MKRLRITDPEVLDLLEGLLEGQRPTPKRLKALLFEASEARSQRRRAAEEPVNEGTRSIGPDRPVEMAWSSIRGAAVTLQGRPGPATLTEAADVLLAVMEPGHQDVVRQVAEEHRWPVWVVMLGAIARAADLQELHAGDYHPDWLNRPETVETVVQEVRCQSCQMVIPRARRNQQFCCSAHGSGKPDHSPGCEAFASLGPDLVRSA